MRINYFYLFYTHELKTSFPFDREKSLASRGHQLLARRELSKFPINPITYKRSRSRHNRCSLWRFDWTLIKHSLSVATANIPNVEKWDAIDVIDLWILPLQESEKRRAFSAQTATVIYRSKGTGSGISGNPMSWELIVLSRPLLLTLCTLFTLSPSSLQFRGFPAGLGSLPDPADALVGFAAISWMRICEFHADTKCSASDRMCAIRNFKSWIY